MAKRKQYVITCVVEMYQEVRISANSAEEAFERFQSGEGRWLRPNSPGDPEFSYMMERGSDGELHLVEEIFHTGSR